MNPNICPDYRDHDDTREWAKACRTMCTFVAKGGQLGTMYLGARLVPTNVDPPLPLNDGDRVYIYQDGPLWRVIVNGAERASGPMPGENPFLPPVEYRETPIRVDRACRHGYFRERVSVPRWLMFMLIGMMLGWMLAALSGCSRDYSQLADLRYERVDAHTIRVHDHTGPAYLIHDEERP